MVKSLLSDALEFARVAHGDQKYGDLPYMVHVEGVVELAKNFGLSYEETVVAALHDVLEDTSVRYVDLVNEFGIEITQTVAVLTRGKNEQYMEYIKRISLNSPARSVKVCDLLYNLSMSKPESTLIKRYQEALYFLATK